jgi:hypothetical protein
MSMQWLDYAFNWAENNDIPITAYRCEEDASWYAKLDLRDGRGWFSVHVKTWPAGKRTNSAKKQRKITDDEYQDDIEKELRSACQVARKKRIDGYVKHGRQAA